MNEPVFSHVEPVLPVFDVPATIRYWQDILAFPNQWIWGDPPVHGGVSWHSAYLQFHLNPQQAKASAGNVIWIRVKYIDELYKIHLERKAEINEPLSLRPWGMHEYAVKDLNGYHIVFSGHSAERTKSTVFPENVIIAERKPTREEFIALYHSVGWSGSLNMSRLDELLSAPVLSVVAIDTTTNETIGCALVTSDNASFYYIKDVMVMKEWQGKRVGTALMKAVSDWIDKNGIQKSLVGLYTGENLEPFYTQFGFSKGFGMVKSI
ncbi:MAG: GNAT family N-acetyltransferase [Bacteroidota bacterium]